MYTAECYEDSVASSFMVGYSDSKVAQMLVSDKVDGGGALNLSPLKFKLFVRELDDRQGCQFKRHNSNTDDKGEDHEGKSEVHQRGDEEDQVKSKQEEKQEDNFDMFFSSLKVQIPSAEESRGLKDEDEGMKTPTSLDQKIIVSLKSPPGAPRKPKALPLKKRKANRQPRLLLDLSREIELLFPPVVCADQLAGGDRIKKKSRQGSSS